jgi:O-antigen/teichoic acid export membrane protein
MFALITMMSGMLVAPLWPAYGEAASRGHMDWVRRTLGRSTLIVLALTSAASIVLLLMARTLIQWWVGSRIHPPLWLLVGLAIWTVVASCGDAIGMFLNGVELMRFEVITASIFGVVCVTAKVFFVRHFGIVGVPWATLASHSLFIALPCAVYIPYFFRRLKRETAAVQ